MPKKIIAIDAMGSDFAPNSEIEGAFEAFAENLIEKDTKIIFVGNELKINEVLNKLNKPNFEYEIIHCEHVITMDDDPVNALKTKKDSSLVKGVTLVKEGKADAFLSAGNTGATMSASTLLLGRIKGVSRPTIGSFFPTENKLPTLIVDVGANVESKPRFLYEFAVMGSLYYKLMLGVENPRIGLLNVGEEPTKGTDTILETFKLLTESNLNFIGNVEGRDIFAGKSDVVICDGFTGNIILKFAESIMSFFKNAMKQYSEKSLINKLKVGLAVPTMKDVFKQFDYQEYGGVPLLGVNGIVIIGHGKSSPKAIKNMILRSTEMIENELNKKIEAALT